MNPCSSFALSHDKAPDEAVDGAVDGANGEIKDGNPEIEGAMLIVSSDDFKLDGTKPAANAPTTAVTPAATPTVTPAALEDAAEPGPADAIAA